MGIQRGRARKVGILWFLVGLVAVGLCLSLVGACLFLVGVCRFSEGSYLN